MMKNKAHVLFIRLQVRFKRKNKFASHKIKQQALFTAANLPIHIFFQNNNFLVKNKMHQQNVHMLSSFLSKTRTNPFQTEKKKRKHFTEIKTHKHNKHIFSNSASDEPVVVVIHSVWHVFVACVYV